jgi:membrane fusion protein (multidrug efflux system)
LKLLHTVVAVVGIGLAGGLAWWVQNKGGPGGATAPSPAGGPVSAPGAVAGGPGGAAAAVPVEVGKVERTTLADDAQAVGTLRARQGVTLRPEVSGRIAAIGFGDGQRVKRGQMLVQLDDALQRAQLQQAQAQEAIARTTLARNRELLAQNFISASAVDQSAAALDVARAQVALAQAQLARMRIVAPFDGIAGIRVVNVGDYVKDGADLVGIEDLSAMTVDFRLPERHVGQLRAGLAVQVQLDALPGRSFRGRIDAIDALLDANGRSLLVRAQLPNPDGVLRSGMFARTRTVFAERANALVVPEEALVPQGGKQWLVKLVGAPESRTTQRIEAKIGMRIPGKAEILAGVAEGDLVVTAGQARLMRADGLAVRVVDLAKAGTGNGGAPAANRGAGGASGAAGAGGPAPNGANGPARAGSAAAV